MGVFGGSIPYPTAHKMFGAKGTLTLRAVALAGRKTRTELSPVVYGSRRAPIWLTVPPDTFLTGLGTISLDSNVRLLHSVFSHLGAGEDFKLYHQESDVLLAQGEWYG